MSYIVSNFIIMKNALLLLCKLINFRQCLPFDVQMTGWGEIKLCGELVPVSSWEQILKCKYFSPAVRDNRGSNSYQMYVLLNTTCHYATMTALPSLVRQGFQVLTLKIKGKITVFINSIH